jgi:predicted TIM-barrel fold metal-dependent hydrolase
MIFGKDREDIMKLAPRNESEAFLCQDADHIHSSAVRCKRRTFLGGLAAFGAGTLFSDQSAIAEAVVDKPFRIDVHHHLSSPEFIAEISGRRTGQVPLMKWTVAQSIDDMNQGGVATAILSISEPSVFFGNFDAARKLARETNEFGAKVIADHPGRFGMFATVPLPDVDGSLREIEYALDTLKMEGVCMMTDYQGKFLGDPAFKPVMEELNRRKAVVYTHPFRNDCCRNLVPDVFEPLIELGTDTTRTIASLLFSGSAEQFSDIKWIFSHAGGTADAAIHLLFCRAKGFTTAASERSRLLYGAVLLRHSECHDHPPVGVAHQTCDADANPVRYRFSFSHGESHCGRSARGRPVQYRGVAGDRARECSPADAEIQDIGASRRIARYRRFRLRTR